MTMARWAAGVSKRKKLVLPLRTAPPELLTI